MNCVNGHEWTEKTTYVNKTSGLRICRPCRQASQIRRRKKIETPPRTLCKRGHEYTEINTRIYEGVRYCRRCGALNAAKHREKKMAA